MYRYLENFILILIFFVKFLEVEVQALLGHSTMKFMYLGATVTAQEPAVAQEQEERLQTRKRLQQQGNLHRT